MANTGGRQRVFFKCKYCKVLFNDATSLVAHKRFEHADQIFGISPNNNKTDWDPIRSADEKSPSKIRLTSPPVFVAKIELHEQPGPSTKVLKIPGISSNRKSDENTRLKCRFCSKTLPSTEKLHEHERIHTGEKPYQCQHCLKGFTEKYLAESHEKKCPVLEILKSEVKKEEKKRPVVPKVPSENGFKPPKSGQSTSRSEIKHGAKNSSYLKKRTSYTRSFPCKICHKNIKYAYNLTRHMKMHERSSDWPKRRVDCFPILKSEKVPFLPQLLKCIGSEGQVNFSCQKCTKRLATRFSGCSHLRTHFGNSIFTCPVCNKTFSTIKEAVTHFNSHPSNITSALEDATEISAYVTRYLDTTAAPERYQDTDTHFTEEEDIDRNCKVFACKLCDYKVSSKPGVGRVGIFRKQIRAHVRRKHTQTNLLKCDNCPRRYVHKCELRNHTYNCKLGSGSSVKPKISSNFSCTICHQNFKDTWNLTRHKETHERPRRKSRILAEDFPVLKTEKLPFIPQLLKCYGSEGQVNFSCKQCDRRFVTKPAGWVHLWKHFGKKVFTCPACPEKCSTMKEVVAHFRSHPASSTSDLEDAAAISEYVTLFLRKMGASERNQDTVGHYTEEEDFDNQRKIFKCKACEYKISSKPGMGHAGEFRKRMRLHIRRMHTRTNLYTCDRCHRGYPMKRELDNHSCKRRLQKTVTMVKTEGFKCPVCPIVFDSNESLAVHNDGHSKLPFLCINCGLWFRLPQDIKGHLVNCGK